MFACMWTISNSSQSIRYCVFVYYIWWFLGRIVSIKRLICEIYPMVSNLQNKCFFICELYNIASNLVFCSTLPSDYYRLLKLDSRILQTAVPPITLILAITLQNFSLPNPILLLNIMSPLSFHMSAVRSDTIGFPVCKHTDIQFTTSWLVTVSG